MRLLGQRHLLEPTFSALGVQHNVAQIAAELFIESAKRCINMSGRFAVALSGGSTPLLMYEKLSEPSFSTQLDWSRVFIFWSDERYVPPQDPESLFGTATNSLLSHVPIPNENVNPWLTTSVSPEGAAHLYTETLRDFFTTARPQFDLILLGMGPDGHTASLFPGSREVKQPSGALTVPVYNAPKLPPTRLSFTWKLINDAKRVVFLVSGSDKANALKSVLEGPYEPARYPAQGVRPIRGELTWVVDGAAVASLSHSTMREQGKTGRILVSN